MPAAPPPSPRKPRSLDPPGPPSAGSALLLTDDEQLADAVTRVAAAAGCDLRRGCAEQVGAGDLLGCGVVLLGEDAAAEVVARLRGPGTGPVVLVGCAPVGAPWWRRAADLDADHAAVLPEAEGWLLELLVDAAAGPRPPGRLVAVVGGCGGGGASVLAAALAQAAAAAAGDALLVDADPLSGGVDLLLGADQLPGLRWADLAGVSGRLRPDVLRSTVDVGNGLHLLSADRGRAPGAAEPSREALDAVVTAARATFAVTVLDLPRGRLPDVGATVLQGCEEVLVVLPATTRAAAAACCVVDDLRARGGPPVRLVVRDVGSGADPDAVADAVGAPLAGTLRCERDLEPALERGEGLPVGRRSAVRSFAQRWLADPPADGGAAR